MKKKSWQRVLLLAGVSLGLIFALTGCGKSSDKASSGSGSSAPVKIAFWHGMSGPYQKALNKIIADFNKSQSKYKVVGTAQGNYTSLQQKVMAAAKSNSLPVISQTTYTTVPDYTENNLIEPLDNYMLKGNNALSTADLKDIYPSFLSSSKYNGKYYSVPFSKSVRILYYNQDILDKYNIEKPKTWNDIVKAGETLKAAGIYSMGFDKSWDMEFEGLARQAGNPLISSKLKANLNTKASLEAANLIMDMIKDGTAKTAGEDFYWTQAFTQGKSAFYAGSSAGVTQMVAQAPKTLNWGTMALPSYNGKKATEIAGNDLVMFKSATTAQKKGAWAFMKYLLSTKETSKWAQATGYVPLRKSATKEASFKTYLSKTPYAKASVDSLDDGFQSTAFHGFSEYRDELLNAVDAMLTKNEAVKKALDAAQTSAEKIIKDNN